MLNYFAGPVSIELPIWLHIIVITMFLGVFLAIVITLVTVAKYSLSVRQKNIAAQTSTKSSGFNLSSYSTATFIDGVIGFSLGYLLGVMGAFGEWNNDVWHTSVVFAAAAFFFIRLISRIAIKASPGEKFLHVNYSYKSRLAATFVDFVIAFTIYLTVNSL